MKISPRIENLLKEIKTLKIVRDSWKQINTTKNEFGGPIPLVYAYGCFLIDDNVSPSKFPLAEENYLKIDYLIMKRYHITLTQFIA